jgi:hypothetical protein
MYVAFAAQEWEITEQTKRNNKKKLTQSGQNDDAFGGYRDVSETDRW